MDAAPRFSVIMNVYNGAAFLDAAIQSVLAQSFTDWELIIWDDCSTDDSARVFGRYRDPRIRSFIAERNTNIGPARNLAMAQARGEWLAFLDQDDIWSPDKLAAQNRLIRADHTGRLGLVYGRSLRFDSHGRVWDFDPWHEFARLPEGDIFRALARKPSFVCLSSTALRRAAVEAIGPIPPWVRLTPDYYLFINVARQHTAAAVQTPCCWYRIHDNNMSRVYRIQIHQEILATLAAQRPALDRWSLRLRGIAHQSLIGWEEIVSGKAPLAGFLRLLVRGSMAYLVMRRAVASYRRLLRWARRRSVPAAEYWRPDFLRQETR